MILADKFGIAASENFRLVIPKRANRRGVDETKVTLGVRFEHHVGCLVEELTIASLARVQGGFDFACGGHVAKAHENGTDPRLSEEVAPDAVRPAQ